MRAAVFCRPQTLEIRDVPTPEITDGEVLLRCRAVSICGTDLRILRFGHQRTPSGTARILGHELAGEVVAVGRGVQGLREGMPVAVAPNFGCGTCEMCQHGWGHLCPEYSAIGLTMDGGMAEYVRIPAAAVRQGCLLPMTAGLSFDEAALNEPFACVYNGYLQCPVHPGDTVLIIGAGPIGAMHMQMARVAGASRVLVADISAERVERARSLGASEVVDSSREDLVGRVREVTRGRGADVVVTACPSPQAQQQAIDVAAQNGRVNFFGGLPAGSEHVSLDTNQIHYKQLIVTGSHGCCTSHCQKTLRLQESRAVDLGPLITSRFSLTDAVEAMAAAAAGKGLKTILLP